MKKMTLEQLQIMLERHDLLESLGSRNTAQYDLWDPITEKGYSIYQMNPSRLL